jgi:hypothetical protein
MGVLKLKKNSTMNEETFKVRAYGFGELAQLYFPNLSKGSASNQLRKWIIENEKLFKSISNAGYKSGRKVLTPAIVFIITTELGTPY